MKRGFSLLEVMIALGILSLSLFVLINWQGTSAVATLEADKVSTATLLAQEKMSQAMLYLESEGFQESDVNEEGDFEDGIFGGFAYGGMDGQLDEINSESYEGYYWALTIREVEINLSGDMGAMAEMFMPAGEQGDAMTEQAQGQDLNDLGVSNDMITEQLSPYIREIRVMIWWDVDDLDAAVDDDSVVELVKHVVNPSGNVVPGQPVGQ